MKFLKKCKKAHFVGIGGIGMSSLASHLIQLGLEVSGSDVTFSDACKRLSDVGATVYIGHSASNVDDVVGLVVYSQATLPSNVEILEAKKRGVTLLSREQLLGLVFNGYDKKVAVCGTHGKTTVTAMIDYVLRKLHVEHSAFVGGFLLDNNSNHSFGGNLVVAEACEYKNSFLNLFPNVVVALNVEHDHPDCFKDKAQVEQSFRRFFDKLPPKGFLLAHESIDKHLLVGKNFATFGTGENCFYKASNVVTTSNGQRFVLHVGNRRYNATLPLVGKHNVTNAVACIATLHYLGINVKTALRALSCFCGVKRRWNKHTIGDVTLIEDYAHHPTEISASIETALNQKGDGPLWVVFQPHTYTRTQALWQQFSTCFYGVDLLVFLPIFPARELPIANVTSQLLLDDVQGVPTKVHLPSVEDAVNYLTKNAPSNTTVLVLGAGDVNQICQVMEDEN